MKYIYSLLIFIICSTESCTKKKVEPIAPIASFTFELGKNGEVKFKNTSQNAIGYQWEFGDGKSSIEINPTHIYKTENTYNVKLIVSSTENIKNEIVQEININNFTPKASFSYEIGEKGIIVLKNSSINSKNFIWTFGDGENSTDTNPSHTYKVNAKYIIKLIASNSTSKDSTQNEVQISNIPASTNVFVCDDNGNCSLINAKKGIKIWQFKTDKYIVSSPTYYNNLLFISTIQDNAPSNIIAIDYQTGIKKWEFKTSGRNISSPIVNENKLYSVSSEEGKLYCIDTKNGRLIWEVSSNNFKDSSPTFDNGFIYVLSDLGLEIFDAQNGKINKSLRISQNPTLRDSKNINGINSYHSSPAIYNDICYFAYRESLYAYNTKTQQTNRFFFESLPYFNSSFSSPTIENDVVYINDLHNLYAVNISDFTKKWALKFPKPDCSTSPYAVDDVVFTIRNSKICAIDSKTGIEKWIKEGGDCSSPNYYDSIVYIATLSELKALDAITGNLIWNFKLNSTGLGLLSSPLIINDKGEAFHSSISGARQ